MRKQITLVVLFLISMMSIINAQEWNSPWSVEYVTSDSPDSLNSIGYNVISVATVEEDAFVALVNRGSANAHYIVGFRGANKLTGRLGFYPYQQVDLQTKWIDFFDQEFIFDANDIASKGSLVYLTNNDEVNHSILVFDLKEDTVPTSSTSPWRSRPSTRASTCTAKSPRR